MDVKKIMKRTLMAGAFCLLFILCLPTLLIFSEGHDGSITIWNFVGIGWLLGIVYVFNKIQEHGQE